MLNNVNKVLEKTWKVYTETASGETEKYFQAWLHSKYCP